EALMVGVWGELLGRGDVGVGEDFFELGGHSLLATRLVSRLRQALGVELPLRAVFEHRTVAELAAHVERLSVPGDVPAPPPALGRRTDSGPAPLSFAQQRLWFLDRLEPGSALYNIAVALRLDGRLDPGTLEWALARVVRNQESLRTSFAERDGRPVQIVAAGPTVELPVVEVQREAELDGLLAEQARRPLPLNRPPLWRALLYRLAPERHVLLFVIHHAVCDAWSLDVLLTDLAAWYGVGSGAGTAAPADLPVQPSDHAVWQREWLRGEALESQLRHWRARLDGGEVPPLELPLDRPRPHVQGHRGGVHRFTVPAALARELRALGGRLGASLFMVLLAGFEVVLARSTGRHDIAVGVPVANRSRVELEGMAGFFVNTLVMRVDAGGDPTFAELLGRVREMALEAYRHQDVPFEKLVEELQPKRDLSRNPLFQVMFSTRVEPSRPDFPGLTVAVEDVETGLAKFDLSLVLTESAGELAGRFDYDADLFEPATIARLGDRLLRVLEAVASAPEQRVAEVDLLGPDEWARLAAWRDASEIQVSATIPELFAAVAAGRGDAEAVAFENQRLSYAELNRRANRLAHHLRGLGLGPEQVVGVRMARSLELVVALLGVLKSGAAYLPLEPESPIERRAWMTREASVRLVVTREWLEAARPALAAMPDTDPAPLAGAANLAYVIYTSGSTGRPKGVMIEHRSVVRLLDTAGPELGIGEDDVWTLFHSYAFDMSVWEMWGPLLSGGRLVVVPHDVIRAPREFLRLLTAERVTVLSQTPSAFLSFVDAAAEDPLPVRLIVLGGEEVRPAALDRWLRRPGRPRLVNMYGITEATVHDTLRDLSAADAVLRHGSPIGRPLRDLRMATLDGVLRPVPLGVTGELYIGGPSVARGYLRRPDLTAERFLPDPFGPPGSRLYKTGDLCRWTASELEFRGRADQQVKVRGYRVELGEIEETARGFERVRECVVVAEEVHAGERELTAYVVWAGEERWDGLRDRLRERLPEYMVPGRWVRLTSVPLTVNGKVDRRRLREVGEEVRGAGRTQAPRTAMEELMAGVWEEVLGRVGVGVGEDFFELGGHSLLATRLVSRLRQVLEVEVPVRAVFEHPTVEGLARVASELVAFDLEEAGR
ncbi:MAG TPA: amino acid adenylation domain-containing protein, partial [Candidatus Dormibacteraeota bacterium]|nr:amino acid adenylation domain-containing protein [Candidatus Dormibacteraeota bacterium]